MRSILVVGCGAIGGLYAARLAQVADVTGLDADAAHVAAINRDGLRLTGCSELVARFPACADPAKLAGRRFDAALILVKSQATRAAFAGLRPHFPGRPLLVTLQNGMGNVEILESMCDWDIAHGVSLEAARRSAPGRIEHLIHGETSWLGPARGALASVAWLGELMCAAGLPTRVVEDPRGAVWAKFIFNSVMNPLGALVLGENRARYQVPEMAALIDRMFEEGIAVARAQGIEPAFDPMLIVRKTRSGEIPLGRHAGSMSHDIAAGRETELEAMTGYLVRKAKELGVPAPATETVYRLAKGLEYAARLRSAAAPG